MGRGNGSSKGGGGGEASTASTAVEAFSYVNCVDMVKVGQGRPNGTEHKLRQRWGR